jgi:DUF1680 family protein
MTISTIILLLCIGKDSSAASGVKVKVVRDPAPEISGGFYSPNRSPLEPTQFMHLPVGSIIPQGWLRNQLELDAKGLTGNYEEVSDYLNYANNGWVDPSKWGWEELPYCLRGFGDLGYVLRDKRITKEAEKWINGILKTQQPDGYFGPKALQTSLENGPDLWPHMLILDALRSYYEYTSDPRIIPFMSRYFKYQSTLPDAVFGRSWAGVRWGDNLNSIYWLYNRTGDSWLLDLAKKIHDNSANYTDNIPTWHNVNLAQGIREPAEYWQQAKNSKFLNATENDYHTVMSTYGQFSGGGFAGDENVRPGYTDPRQGFETCGIVEFMHTFEIMNCISGNPIWADRCEDLAFNSFPAALDPQHRATHYITPANLIQIDNVGKQHNQFANGTFPMLGYMAGVHNYRCCPHNLGMGWPYYAESLWLATADKGLCANLYSASDVKAKVGSGEIVSIKENTEYPFEDTIQFTISAPKAIQFPIYLRVPDWCSKPSVKINGKSVAIHAEPLSYIVLEKTWNEGDVISLTLPMRVTVKTWKKNKDSVSVNYGPLAFSLDIKEKWVNTDKSTQWPQEDVYPESAWNYGLVLNSKNPAIGIKVVRKPGPLASQPFTPQTSPIELKVKAKEIPGWQADSDNVVTVLQQSPAISDQPTKTITLIPMGAARLRITSFPTIGNGPDAHVWQVNPIDWPKLSASIVHDILLKPNTDDTPKSSGDQTIPRFTWWDHLGTSEWFECEFQKPQQLKGISVYWFDDTGVGQCRVPKSWELQYKDGDNWKPVEGASDYGTEANKYNSVSFTPITTSAIRIQVQLQPNFSGGILSWKTE